MKKLFFLALMAFLWLPATTWASEDEHEGTHESGQVPGSDDEVYDGEEEGTDGKIVPSTVQLQYHVLSAPSDGNNGTVELDGIYSGEASTILIPHEIQVYNGISYDYYTVVGVAEGAFGAMSRTNADQTITSVTIPYTVTYLGQDYTSGTWTGCFTYCQNLTSVTFAESSSTPSQLATIGTSAFQNCTGLTSIDIPSSVETIGSSAFYGCSNLASINFPSESSLTTISQSAFQNCTALTEVAIPEGVSLLENSEFYGCSSLKTVWMPGSIQLYGNVFRNCTSLSAIVLEGEPGENGGTESSEVFTGDGGEAITLYVETGLAPAYLASAWETDLESESSSYAVLSWNFNEIGIYYDFYEEEDGEQVNYATYYTDAVGEFSSDVTPNIVIEAGESGAITYQEVTGYIPANTGLLLSAPQSVAPTADFATYYYHPYETTISSVETADVSSNMLLGTNDANGITTVGPNDESEGYYFYKLSLDADDTPGTLGFYWGVEGGGQFTSAAHKAYLAVAVSSDEDDPAPTHYSFKKDEGDTTGISAVESASEKVVKGIYTIQGVRVNNMNQPGLYIVDGKKVLVK